MTLTASDIGSVAMSLSRWETAEYVSAGFVTLGCIGEYVADFTNWFTDGVKERKDNLAKRSTLLLIAALALELICLVKTNALYGTLIGSLKTKAEEAQSKAGEAADKSGTALFQAKDALAKAGQAEQSLGKAEAEANKAQTASSNALTLAMDARREADSFEKDIASAKKQVDGLSKEILIAKSDLVALQSLVSARHIIADKFKPLIEDLKPFKGKSVVIMSWAGDEEGRVFCKSISSALQSAEIDTNAGCGAMGGSGGPAGVFITSSEFSTSELLAKALRDATGAGFIAVPNDPNNTSDKIRIIVGPKNPFWIGK